MADTFANGETKRTGMYFISGLAGEVYFKFISATVSALHVSIVFTYERAIDKMLYFASNVRAKSSDATSWPVECSY